MLSDDRPFNLLENVNTRQYQCGSFISSIEIRNLNSTDPVQCLYGNHNLIVAGLHGQPIYQLVLKT